MGDDHETKVRVRAYERWEREGRPEGRADEHWLDAERDLASGESSQYADGAASETERQGISNRSPAEEFDRQQRLPPRGQNAPTVDERRSGHDRTG